MAQTISDVARDHPSAHEVLDLRMSWSVAPPSRAPINTSYGMLVARGVSILLILGALIIGANALLVPFLNQFL